MAGLPSKEKAELAAANKRFADLETELAVARRAVELLREEAPPIGGSERSRRWLPRSFPSRSPAGSWPCRGPGTTHGSAAPSEARCAARLTVLIRQVHTESRGIYGGRRGHAEANGLDLDPRPCRSLHPALATHRQIASKSGATPPGRGGPPLTHLGEASEACLPRSTSCPYLAPKYPETASSAEHRRATVTPTEHDPEGVSRRRFRRSGWLSPDSRDCPDLCGWGR